MSEPCAACHDDQGGGHIVETGDGDGVRLCQRCACIYNVDVVRRGIAYVLPDGTPTMMARSAELSADGVHRYSLTRSWLAPHGNLGPPVVWIGLNPSDANAHRDDPTAKRMAGFAHRWGHHRQIVVNPFAFISSTPALLPRVPRLAIGDGCDDAIRRALGQAGRVIACWGAPAPVWLASMLRERVRVIASMVTAASGRLLALAVNSDGSPKHPMARGKHRIPDLATPSPWSPA